MMNVDISCDLGEASTPEGREIELAIWPLISSANVACGGNAGDEASMREAVALARQHGVRLGAHPSFPDRDGFGRRPMEISDEALVASLASQIEALRTIAETEGGVSLVRVKPHGALYNRAHHDARLARCIAEAMVSAAPRAALVCSPDSAMEHAARERGLLVIREAFADRRYLANGALVPRSDPRALLEDPEEAAAQAVLLATRARVLSVDGSEIAVAHDTICIHSDTQGAVARLLAIRAALTRMGLTLERLAQG